jgi:tetratricopeptide (TPR) repeat protein
MLTYNFPKSKKMPPKSIFVKDRIFEIAARTLFCGLVFLSFSLFSETVPEDIERVRLLADKALEDNNLPLAIKYNKQLRGLVKDPKQTVDIALTLISLLLDAGEDSEASGNIKEFEKLFEQQVASTPQIRARLEYFKGILCLRSENYDEAISRLKSLIEPYALTDSDFNCRAIFALSMTYAAIEDWASAVNYAKKMESEGAGTRWEEAGKSLSSSFMMMSENPSFPDFKAPDDPEKLELSDVVRLFACGSKDAAYSAYKSLKADKRKSNPASFHSLFILSGLSLNQRDIDGAALFIEGAMNLAPQEILKRKLIVLSAELSEIKGDFNSAIESYKKFLADASPRERPDEIRLKYASALRRAGRNEEALLEYDKVIRTADAKLSLRSACESVSLLIALKNYAKADEIVRTAVALDAPDARGRAALLSAEISFAKEEWLKAADLFAKLANDFPEYRERGLLGEIKAYYSAGNYEKTISLVEKDKGVFLSSEVLQDAFFINAMAMKKLGKKREASLIFLSFSEKYPNSPLASQGIFEAAKISLEEGEYKDGAEKFALLYSKYPDSALAANALYRKIYCGYLSGDLKQTENDITLITAKYPRSEYSAFALIWLADMNKNAGKDEEAEKIYPKILKEYPDFKELAAEALYELAVLSRKKGETQKALSLLDELSEKFPEQSHCSEGYFLRGDILSGNSEYEKAIPFFMKASVKRPGSLLAVASFGRLGDCYFALSPNDPSNLVKAADYYRKVLDSPLAPIDIREQAMFKFGRCEEKLGDYGAALAKYRELIYNYEADWDRGLKRDALWLSKSGDSAIKIYLEKGNEDGLEMSEKLYSKLLDMGVDTIKQMRQNIDALREKIKNGRKK